MQAEENKQNIPKEVRQVIDFSIRSLNDLSPDQIVIHLLKTEETYVTKVLGNLVDTFQNRLTQRINIGKPVSPCSNQI